MRKMARPRKTQTATNYEYYLLGLIDGMAFGRAVDVWAGKGGHITQVQFYYWMDAYCEKNPLDFAVTATFNFANEMSDGLYKKKMQR